MANVFSRVSCFVQDALCRKSTSQAASQSLIWGVINSFFISMLLFDLYYGGISSDGYITWWFIVGLCFICTINIFYHLKSYLEPTLFLDSFLITDKQRKLLGISENDLGFSLNTPPQNTLKTLPEQSPKFSELFQATIRTPTSPLIGTCGVSSPDRSWLSSSPSDFHHSFPSSNSSFIQDSSFSPVRNLSQSFNISSNLPSISDSWTYHRGSPSVLDSSYSPILVSKGDSFNSSHLSTSLREGRAFSPMNNSVNMLNSSSPIVLNPGTKRFSISTKDELEEYLKDFQEKERKKQILSESENENDANKSLWAFNSNSSFDFLNSLKHLVYQSASKDSESVVQLNKKEDTSMSYLTGGSVSKIWLRRNVTPKDLFQFEENLRIWIAMNILQPLVELIDSCNKTLASVAPELQIGNVGVDKLRKAAQNITGVKHLNYLLPYLDVTLHQDYLVQRLRELSKGGAISAYKWNSGSSFKGLPWREEYPTDTFILLYLFSMYMDNHLPPDPTQPDGRVFSNVHVVKTPEKPPLPTNQPYLYLSQINPPHLKVILPPEQECELGGGHKNFLHCLILFCHYIVFDKHSQISGVDLKLSGINLAWVVNAE